MANINTMSSGRSERVVHPSFVVPMFGAADKENEIHAPHSNTASYPMTPGNKPHKKGKAMTTGRAKNKTTSLLSEKPVRVPLSSKKMNRASDYAHHHAVNPFAGCDVSIHENDHCSVHALAGSATKAKDFAKDDHHIGLLYHVGGPISSQHAARVRTPHGKVMARTPLIPKRMGVDGTYKTPSKELLRSTACSRGHEHHPHHPQHQPFLGRQTAMTTGGKAKKARENARSRHFHDQSHNEEEDIALRVPHVTFRGDVVADTTFDADLGTDVDDDISALSIHLDCHVPESHGVEHSFNVPAYVEQPAANGTRFDDQSIGSVADELELCHFGNESGASEDILREGAINPVATTLHAEHFVMQHSKTASRPLLAPDDNLPQFMKERPSQGAKNSVGVVVRPSVRHRRR